MTEIAWRKVALLIDADNVPPKLIASVMAWDGNGEIGRFVVRRVYGNLNTLSKVAWRNLIHEHAMTPILALPATGTKNAADMRLAIDAMDLVRERDLDAMCIVSSDSDFAALAIRVRESGLVVFGFGEAKTPAPYAAACNVFRQLGEVPPPRPAKPIDGRRSVATEDGSGTRPKSRSSTQMALPLVDDAVAGPTVTIVAAPPTIIAAPPPPPAKPGKAQIPVAEILASIAESAKADGWSLVNDVRMKLEKHLPHFNLTNYGYRKFSDLVIAIDGIEKHQVKSGSGTSLAVRLKTATPPPA